MAVMGTRSFGPTCTVPAVDRLPLLTLTPALVTGKLVKVEPVTSPVPMLSPEGRGAGDEGLVLVETIPVTRCSRPPDDPVADAAAVSMEAPAPPAAVEDAGDVTNVAADAKGPGAAVEADADVAAADPPGAKGTRGTQSWL